MACASSFGCIGPTSTWLSPSRRDSRGMGGARAVVVGSQGQHDRDPAVVALRRVRQRIHERGTLRLVAARRERLLELVYGQQQLGLRLEARERGRDRVLGPVHPKRASQVGQRMLAGAEQDALPALAARKHSARQRRQQPARTADDLPLPEGPTTPSRLAPTSRATISRDEPLAAEEVIRVGDLEARRGP